jgi:hypothetical protein
MGVLRRFLERSAAERRLLLAAWVWLLLILASLHTRGLDRTRRRLARARRVTARSATFEPGLIAAAVESAARWVPGAHCLPQALAAQRLLARQGTPASLRVGVRRNEDGAFGAHAWLEHEGQVVFGEARPEAFTPLSDFEGGSA